MKKTFVTIIAGMALTFPACKKETHTEPFNPVGYWKGYMYYYSTAILNRADGTSRFFIQIFEGDTSDNSGCLKYEGRYTVNGNNFRSSYKAENNDNFIVESNQTSPTVISGFIYKNIGAFPFEIKKQP